MRREISSYEKFFLFDLDNFKRKVRENPTKYDKRHNLVQKIIEARENGQDEICLPDTTFDVNDIWVIDAMNCKHESEDWRAGYYFSSNNYIFLTDGSYEKYSTERMRRFAECLSSFSGLI